MATPEWGSRKEKTIYKLSFDLLSSASFFLLHIQEILLYNIISLSIYGAKGQFMAIANKIIVVRLVILQGDLPLDESPVFSFQVIFI